MDIPETEQWKLVGNCEKCRRQQFCTKECTARKKAHEAKIRAIENALYDRMTNGLIPRTF